MTQYVYVITVDDHDFIDIPDDAVVVFSSLEKAKEGAKQIFQDCVINRYDDPDKVKDYINSFDEYDRTLHIYEKAIDGLGEDYSTSEAYYEPRWVATLEDDLSVEFEQE